MDFDNQTELTAKLLTTILPDPREMMATLVVKACVAFDLDGRGVLDADTEVPIFPEPTETDLGVLPSDEVMGKQGVDVVALGYAYSKEIDGGLRRDVTATVGREARSVAVFGDRRWEKDPMGAWRISEPEPFVMQKMLWTYCFGGIALDPEGKESPHLLNMDGMGYALDDARLADTCLPNIEDPRCLISAPLDTPIPCNIAPALPQMKFDYEEYIDRLKEFMETRDAFVLPPNFWNAAHPRFRFDAVKANDLLTLTGMTDEQPLQFKAPELGASLDIRVGDLHATASPAIDTVVWLPEDDKCFLTWRHTFKYPFRERDKRAAVLGATRAVQAVTKRADQG